MGKVVDVVKSAFAPSSKGANRAMREQTAAIADQNAALEERERSVAAVAEGQRRSRQSNRGLLAFIEPNLARTFGGG